jgi:hypothetical protein
MRPYVIVTGVLFGLVTLAHIWRLTEEPDLLKQPFFIVITLAAAAMCLWSFRAARRGQ